MSLKQVLTNPPNWRGGGRRRAERDLVGRNAGAQRKDEWPQRAADRQLGVQRLAAGGLEPSAALFGHHEQLEGHHAGRHDGDADQQDEQGTPRQCGSSGTRAACCGGARALSESKSLLRA